MYIRTRVLVVSWQLVTRWGFPTFRWNLLGCEKAGFKPRRWHDSDVFGTASAQTELLRWTLERRGSAFAPGTGNLGGSVHCLWVGNGLQPSQGQSRCPAKPRWRQQLVGPQPGAGQDIKFANFNGCRRWGPPRTAPRPCALPERLFEELKPSCQSSGKQMSHL